MQRNAGIDRVDPGRVDGVAVVPLDRRLHLVDVLDLVGAGRLGRRRRYGPVGTCRSSERESESRDRGDPRHERNTNGPPATERRERTNHRASTSCWVGWQTPEPYRALPDPAPPPTARPDDLPEVPVRPHSIEKHRLNSKQAVNDRPVSRGRIYPPLTRISTEGARQCVRTSCPAGTRAFWGSRTGSTTCAAQIPLPSSSSTATTSARTHGRRFARSSRSSGGTRAVSGSRSGIFR